MLFMLLQQSDLPEAALFVTSNRPFIPCLRVHYDPISLPLKHEILHHGSHELRTDASIPIIRLPDELIRGEGSAVCITLVISILA